MMDVVDEETALSIETLLSNFNSPSCFRSGFVEVEEPSLLFEKDRYIEPLLLILILLNMRALSKLETAFSNETPET